VDYVEEEIMPLLFREIHLSLRGLKRKKCLKIDLRIISKIAILT
jgi:hypothetical protein